MSFFMLGRIIKICISSFLQRRPSIFKKIFCLVEFIFSNLPSYLGHFLVHYCPKNQPRQLPWLPWWWWRPWIMVFSIRLILFKIRKSMNMKKINMIGFVKQGTSPIFFCCCGSLTNFNHTALECKIIIIQNTIVNREGKSIIKLLDLWSLYMKIGFSPI